MANIFRTAYNRIVGRDTKTQYFDPDKLGIAVPDMSYSPREIIERFTMGTLPNIGIPELIQDMDEVELARLLDGDDVEELENDKLLMNQQLGEKYVGPNIMGQLLMSLRDNGKLKYSLPSDALAFIELLK